MNEGSQIVVPPSFVAVHTRQGRLRPDLFAAELVARHELCEDMANMLSEHASNQRWDTGATEWDVLQRVYRGLLDSSTGLSVSEAGWVLHRLAELLDWPQPDDADLAALVA